MNQDLLADTRHTPSQIKLPTLLLASVLLSGACGGSDSSADADASPVEFDAAPAAPHVVYLAYDGVDLTSGGNFDDPVSNNSAALTQDYTVPSFIADDANREVRLDLITDSVQATLAPYNIEVVSERPSEPGYDMIVFGGNSLDAGFSGNFPTVGRDTCVASPIGLISFVFEFGGYQAFGYANWAVAEIGLMNALPMANVNGDCMCWGGPNCEPRENAACAIGGPGTATDPSWMCGGPAEMDEHALWLEQFGAAL